MMGASVTITRHTTASKPNLHVVYTVEVVMNGSCLTIKRRYSEFVALHSALNDEFSLPAKRLLETSLFPSAWIDDMLLAERKAGLAEYLAALLWSPEYQTAPALIDFLKRDTTNPKLAVDLEDYLPSTLSRKNVLAMARTASAKYELNGAFVASAYYPSWAASSVPPETVDYAKYDIVFFAYATPSSTATLDWSAETRAILQRVVKSAAASEATTKIVLAIGGSEGSQWFSHICSTTTNRIAFVATLVATVKEFGLAGVAIDWETPNLKAFGNPYSPTDAANFLKLLKALRSALGTASVISAAVGRLPWIGEDGFASTDVSEFSEQLSFINVMNYGAYTTSSPVAHSSLGNAGDDSKAPFTAEGAISAWISAGFPTSKILLGIALFGYVYKTRKTSVSSIDALDSFASSTFIGSHKEVTPKLLTNAFISSKSLSAWRGLQTPFKNIVKSGALVKRFDSNYGQGDGYTLAWDDVSSTPYLFNTEKRTLVVFDNTRSIAAKVHFAKAKGLGGCCTWSLDQDDGTTLQDVIHTAIGE